MRALLRQRLILLVALILTAPYSHAYRGTSERTIEICMDTLSYRLPLEVSNSISDPAIRQNFQMEMAIYYHKNKDLFGPDYSNEMANRAYSVLISRISTVKTGQTLITEFEVSNFFKKAEQLDETHHKRLKKAMEDYLRGLHLRDELSPSLLALVRDLELDFFREDGFLSHFLGKGSMGTLNLDQALAGASYLDAYVLHQSMAQARESSKAIMSSCPQSFEAGKQTGVPEQLLRTLSLNIAESLMKQEISVDQMGSLVAHKELGTDYGPIPRLVKLLVDYGMPDKAEDLNEWWKKQDILIKLGLWTRIFFTGDSKEIPNPNLERDQAEAQRIIDELESTWDTHVKLLLVEVEGIKTPSEKDRALKKIRDVLVSRARYDEAREAIDKMAIPRNKYQGYLNFMEMYLISPDDFRLREEYAGYAMDALKKTEPGVYGSDGAPHLERLQAWSRILQLKRKGNPSYSMGDVDYDLAVANIQESFERTKQEKNGMLNLDLAGMVSAGMAQSLEKMYQGMTFVGDDGELHFNGDQAYLRSLNVSDPTLRMAAQLAACTLVIGRGLPHHFVLGEDPVSDSFKVQSGSEF